MNLINIFKQSVTSTPIKPAQELKETKKEEPKVKPLDPKDFEVDEIGSIGTYKLFFDRSYYYGPTYNGQKFLAFILSGSANNTYQKQNQIRAKIDKSFTIKNSIDKLNGDETVYFIPKTVFNRKYFRTLYPDVKFCKNADKADVIIFDDERAKPVPASSVRGFCKIDSEKKEIYNDQYFLQRNSNWNNYQLRNTIKAPADYNLELFLIKESDYLRNKNIRESFKDKTKKFINVKDLFMSIETDIRKENINPKEIEKYLKQITSNDINSVNSGLSVILQLNPNQYLPIQYLACCLLGSSAGNKLIKNNRSYQIVSKIFGGDIINIDSHLHNSNGSMTALNSIIQKIDQKNCFTSEMEYDQLINFFLSDSNNQKAMKFISFEYKLSEIRSSKINLNMSNIEENNSSEDSEDEEDTTEECEWDL